MPPKKNPLKLNPLQLRTLALFQELARYPDTSTKDEATGEVTISALPHLHGNHAHLGRFVVSARDVSGLANEAVWIALARKGLAKSDFSTGIVLLPAALEYDTGLTESFLGHSDH
jgi:hypothetical protein